MGESASIDFVNRDNKLLPAAAASAGVNDLKAAWQILFTTAAEADGPCRPSIPSPSSGEEGEKFFLSLVPHPPPPLTEGGGQEKGGLEGRPPNAIGRDICTTPSLSPLPYSTQCKCLHKHFLFSSPLSQSFKRAVSECGRKRGGERN